VSAPGADRFIPLIPDLPTRVNYRLESVPTVAPDGFATSGTIKLEARGTDVDSGLTEIDAKAFFPDRGLFDVHTHYSARGRWADGVPLVQRTDPQAGVTFTGSEGWLFVMRGAIEAGPSTILEETIGTDEL